MKAKAKGLDEVRSFLKDSLPQEAKKMVRASLKDGAKPILEKAIELAPKLSGKLAGSLKIKGGGGSKGKGKLSVSVRTDSKSLFQGDTFYAGMQEFGFNQVPWFRVENGQIRSMPRGTKPTTHREGKHFMGRAVTDAAESAVETFAASIKARIGKAKAKK